MPVGKAWGKAAHLCSEGHIVVSSGAHDVTLVLQELQHLLQHSLVQGPAEVQAHTAQNMHQVAALLHICGKGRHQTRP